MVQKFLLLCLGVFISGVEVSCETADETPIRITVNKLIAELHKNVTGGYESKYYYVKGDSVNVFCSHNEKHVTLSVFYSYSKSLGESSGVISGSSSDYGIGFITHLQEDHHNSYFECMLLYKQKNVTARIIFLMESDPKDDVIKIIINNNSVRPQRQEKENSIDINYEYFVNETIIVIIEGNVTYVENKTLADINHDVKVVTQDKNRFICFIFNIKDKNKGKTKYFEVQSTSFKKNSSTSVEVKNTMLITIHFFPELYKNIGVECPYNLEGLKHYSIALQYYQRTFKKIYYDLYEGERLTLNCRLPPCDPNFKTELAWLNKTRPGNKAIDIVLNKDFEGVNIYCYFMDNDNKTLRNTTVILRKKLNNTMTSETQLNSSIIPTTNKKEILNSVDDYASSATTFRPINVENKGEKEENDGDNMMWVLISISICTCIVIVTVVTVIYKMYRLRQERNDLTNNLLSHSITSIPAYPSQWDNRYVSSDRSSSTIYTEPRTSRSYYSFLRYNYARGNRFRNSQGSELSCTEIYCNGNRPSERGYYNVNRPRYVNYDIEYVDPAYSEICPSRS